jgi:hypothetical protein
MTDERLPLRLKAFRRLKSLNIGLVRLEGKKPFKKGWQKEPDSHDIAEAWLRTGKNLGVLCGRYEGVQLPLIVIDVDGDDADHAMVLIADLNVPDTWMVRSGRRGGGGIHLYFRMPDGFDHTTSRGNLPPKIDVRATGGQVVCAGSIHPGSGALYEWVEQHSPANLPIAELPAHLCEALKATKKAPTPPVQRDDHDLEKQIEEFNAGHAQDWKTFERACPFCKHNDCFGPLPDDESKWFCFSTGHDTFGQQSEQGWWGDALDFVCLGMSKDGTAGSRAAVLREVAGESAPKVDISGLLAKEENGTKPAVNRQRVAFPEDLLDVPGLLKDVCDWINRTAPRPQPVLALANALAAFGAFFGRRYRSPTNLRTNLYVLGVAASGAGKDHSRGCIKALFMAAGLQDMIGGERLASGQAVIKALKRNAVQLFQIDEFGDLMHSAATQGNAHKADILNVMKHLSGSANTWMPGQEYASDDRERDDLFEPHACFYGTSTPAHLFSALTSDRVADGYLNRMLIFRSGDDLPIDNETGGLEEPPENLVGAMQHAREIAAPDGNLVGATGDGSTGSAARMVPYASGASVRRVRAAIAVEVERAPNALRDLWPRCQAHAIQLALVRACATNPVSPEISAEDLDWGLRVARYSTTTLVDCVEGYVADNKQEADSKRVLRAIEEAGEMTQNKLVRATRWLEARRRDDIMKTLREGGYIETDILKTKGRPRVVHRRCVCNEEEL